MSRLQADGSGNAVRRPAQSRALTSFRRLLSTLPNTTIATIQRPARNAIGALKTDTMMRIIAV